MKLLSLSGGATRFVGLAGCAESVIMSGFKPDMIAGISAGAIATVPLAMELFNEIARIGTSITLDDIFDVKPINNKGNFSFRGLLRLVCGKDSLGVMNVTRLVKKLVTKDMFAKYKELYLQGKVAKCLVTAVEMTSAKRKVFDLTTLNYEEYLQAVAASAAIPMIASPIEINGLHYVDGGLRDHNPAEHVLETMNDTCRFTEVVSIYARPKEVEDVSESWKKGFLNVFGRTMDIMNWEISKSDERHEIDFCKQNNIILKQLFLPRILDSLFDTDSNRLKNYYAESKKIGDKLIV